MAWGLVPGFIIGDMDSLPDRAREALFREGSQFLEHPRAKDETDLELALSFAAEQGAQEIIVFGALGGRLDHTLSNLLLLTLPILDGVAVRIVRGCEEALLVRGDEEVTLSGSPGDLVSLLPWGGAVHGITTHGLTWPLKDETLKFGFSRGVSNEMAASEACIAVKDGYLLVVHGPCPAG
jgi:thiamine pyrophosphokinase